MKAPSETGVMEKHSIVYPLLPASFHGTVAPLFQEWATIVEEYESNPASLRAAWLYLGHHPAFWRLQDGPGGSHLVTGAGWYQYIETGIEEDGQVWLEIFPSLWPDDMSWEDFHKAGPDLPDWHLNISGATFEEVVKRAAEIIHAQYGNDREFINAPLQGRWQG